MRFLSVHPLQFTDPPATFEPVGSLDGPAGPVPVYGFETDDPDLAAHLRDLPASFGVAERDWPVLPDVAAPQDAPVAPVNPADLVPGSPAADQLQPVPAAPETPTYDTPPTTPVA